LRIKQLEAKNYFRIGVAKANDKKSKQRIHRKMKLDLSGEVLIFKLGNVDHSTQLLCISQWPAPETNR
jgi:hypothetical protein